MSEEDKKRIREELEDEEIEEVTEEKEEKTEEEKPSYITKDDLEKILDDRLPKPKPKTVARHKETNSDDLPTCPHCHGVVQETNDGWVCHKCKKGYIK